MVSCLCTVPCHGASGGAGGGAGGHGEGGSKGVVDGGEDKGWVGVVKGRKAGWGVVNNSSTLPRERSQYTRHSNFAFCFGNSCLVIFFQAESCMHNGNKSFNGMFRARLR